MEPLEAGCSLHKLWEAPDREALLDACAPRVRAIATRGELCASGELIVRLPCLEIMACYGVDTDAVDLAAARAASASPTRPTC